MNNTKKRNLTAMFAILMAATLIVGAGSSVTTRAAFAANNNNGNTVTIEECKNRGSASGFDTATNQECENLICTHPCENAACVQEGAAAVTPIPPPAKLACEQCFTTILTPEEIARFTGSASIAQFCAILERGEFSEEQFRNALNGLGITSVTTQNELIACLIQQAGIVFAPPT